MSALTRGVAVAVSAMKGTCQSAQERRNKSIRIYMYCGAMRLLCTHDDQYLTTVYA